MRWTRIGGTAAPIAALAIALALSLGLWNNWTASAQDTFVVNQDTGTGDPAPCDDPDFPSVSDNETVIDDTDVADGDTLVLCPGTYTAGAGGAVEVNKKLTIEGLATADRDDVVVQGTAGGHGFVIRADDVKIVHLKLVGPGTGGADEGIHLHDVSPTAFKNAEFSDLEVTNWNTGVYIEECDDSKVGPNNKIHANAAGVTILGGPHGGQRDMVFNNEIGPNAATGINLEQVDEAYVQENTLAGNVAAQIAVTGESNVLIWNNNIQATTSFGVLVASDTADTLVQIGGSPQRTNNFTGTLAAGVGFYARLDCASENTVDATYNYWNGINSNAGIAPVVFNDEFDDPASATADCPDPGGSTSAVVVHPFVTTQWTPTATPTPTATGTATATATPTPTPGATRTVSLSPAGWHDLTWSGPDATDPTTALTCISGKFSIGYMWVGTSTPPQWLRYVPGQPLLSNITALNKYDSLLVDITASGVSCVMPVAQ